MVKSMPVRRKFTTLKMHCIISNLKIVNFFGIEAYTSIEKYILNKEGDRNIFC
jgi:hypothetical protein